MPLAILRCMSSKFSRSLSKGNVLARSLVAVVSGDQPPRLRSSKSGTVYFVLNEVSQCTHYTIANGFIIFTLKNKYLKLQNIQVT